MDKICRPDGTGLMVVVSPHPAMNCRAKVSRCSRISDAEYHNSRQWLTGDKVGGS
ncbi:MAG: hypothetical protein JXL67_10895 [Calditrichaeota bacterium]|nr:hypothetical protein [Calditrichota bacterium]